MKPEAQNVMSLALRGADQPGGHSTCEIVDVDVEGNYQDSPTLNDTFNAQLRHNGSTPVIDYPCLLCRLTSDVESSTPSTQK
mmetsp:Transcript_454/g.493  ORF Transcript_454/g.493 Transcript_454/m.493 type:complete len:82 (-) Transcript_454:2119-2364(-)